MAVQPAVTKKSTKVMIVFVIAQVIVVALLLIVFFGTGDREGRIKVALAVGKAAEVQNAIAGYYADNQILPADNNALRLPGKQGKPFFSTFEEQGEPSYSVSVANGVITLTFSKNQEPVSDKSLVFIPRISNGKLEWSCYAGSVDAAYLPPQCQSQK